MIDDYCLPVHREQQNASYERKGWARNLQREARGNTKTKQIVVFNTKTW